MWKVTGASVIGLSHISASLPCQDYNQYFQSEFTDGPALLIGIADGAGSASFSEKASFQTVNYLMQLISRFEGEISQIDQKQAENWLLEARKNLTEFANLQQIDLKELATTLMFGILGRKSAIFFQIGDGAWVVKKDGVIEVAIWPQKGEFANETKFLTSPNFESFIDFKKYDVALEAAAGFTDGIHPLALSYLEKKAYEPFFEGMFEQLNNVDDPTSLLAPLMTFLSSEKVNERTDDDKTLVLAYLAE